MGPYEGVNFFKFLVSNLNSMLIIIYAINNGTLLREIGGHRLFLISGSLHWEIQVCV